MMTRHLAGLACAAALFTVSAAHADNRSRVESFALSDGTFEVVALWSESALYWCGASLAARDAGISESQRLYVQAGIERSSAVPGARAVRFSPTPPAGVGNVSTFSNSVNIIGNSLTVAQAYQTCTERTASG